MSELLEVVLQGVEIGSLYAMVALAIALIYRSAGVVNLAQGEMATLTTYMGWSVVATGFGIWSALGVAMIAAFLLGCAIERLIMRPVRDAPPLAVALVTIGLLIAINGFTGWRWGFLPKPLPTLLPHRSWAFGALTVDSKTLTTVGALLVLVVGLNLMFSRTKFGLALQAAALDRDASVLIGVDVDRLLMFGWGISASLGAVAGILVAPTLFLNPNMMFAMLVFGLSAAILGGLDSLTGAVIGGIAVGLIESLAGNYITLIGSDLKVPFALTLMAAVLVLRPHGFLGSPQLSRM